MNATADTDPLAVPAFAEACDLSHPAATPPPPGPGPRTARGAEVPAYWKQPSAGRSYPLRLYLDLVPLARSYPRIVAFDEWVRCARKKRRRRSGVVDTTVSGKTGRVASDRVYCVTERGGPGKARVRKACSRTVGPYAFSTVWSPPADRTLKGTTGVALARAASVPGGGHMSRVYRHVLKSDTSKNMFLSEVWQGSLLPAGTFTSVLAFNDIHRHALRVWLQAGRQDVERGGFRSKPRQARGQQQQQGGGVPPLNVPSRLHAAFHWATSTVPEWKLAGCSGSLAKATARMTGWAAWAGLEGSLRQQPEQGGEGAPSPRPPPPFHPSSVLISDLPAPANPCHAWASTASSPSDAAAAAAPRKVSPARRKAIAALLRWGGVRKYDEDHPGVDSGVLAIRDYLLARDAHTYVTCHGSGAKPPPAPPGPVGKQLAAAQAGLWTDAECRACARTDSPYVEALLAVRRAKGKASLTSWFSAKSSR